MNSITLGPGDESLTRRLGRALAHSLPVNAVIALIGPLGAGKTRIVQAVAEAAGIEPGTVTSPTFVLVHEYAGRVPIFHFDVYRMRDEDEFLAIGPEEYFAREGWTFIEWADRVTSCLPPDHLQIEVELAAADQRRFNIQSTGPQYQNVIDQLADALALR